MVLFSHQFLIGIVGQPIVTLEYFGIGSIKHIKDGAVLEYEILVFVSGLLAEHLEDVECVEEYLVFLEFGNID